MDEENASLQLPVTLEIPVNFPSRYAHHMVIQHDGPDVLLNFFELIPPIFPNDQEQRSELIDALKSGKTGLNSVCTSRIRVSKLQFGAFADLFQRTKEQIEKEIEGVKTDADN